MIKIIHGADFHLDSPFSGLGPQHSAQRRSELRQLPRRLADLARAEGADLVLLSGDLLDGQHIYRETAQALAEALVYIFFPPPPWRRWTCPVWDVRFGGGPSAPPTRRAPLWRG